MLIKLSLTKASNIGWKRKKEQEQKGEPKAREGFLIRIFICIVYTSLSCLLYSKEIYGGEVIIAKPDNLSSIFRTNMVNMVERQK